MPGLAENDQDLSGGGRDGLHSPGPPDSSPCNDRHCYLVQK